jgi:hypothetical protein
VSSRVYRSRPCLGPQAAHVHAPALSARHFGACSGALTVRTDRYDHERRARAPGAKGRGLLCGAGVGNPLRLGARKTTICGPTLLAFPCAPRIARGTAWQCRQAVGTRTRIRVGTRPASGRRRACPLTIFGDRPRRARGRFELGGQTRRVKPASEAQRRADGPPRR